MTTEELLAAKARAEAASPGPWRSDDDHRSIRNPFGVDVVSSESGTPYGIRRDEDREFIAHAREDIPALLKELAKQYAQIVGLQADHYDTLKELGEALADRDAGDTEIAACERRIEELRRYLGAANADADQLQGERDQARAEVDKLKQWRDVGVLEKNTELAKTNARLAAELAKLSTKQREALTCLDQVRRDSPQTPHGLNLKSWAARIVGVR